MLAEVLTCARHVPGAFWDREAKGADTALADVCVWWKDRQNPRHSTHHSRACWETGLTAARGEPGRVSGFERGKR